MAGAVFGASVGFHFGNPVTDHAAIVEPTNQQFAEQGRGNFQHIAEEEIERKTGSRFLPM
jgi:hypothetical protein